MELVHVPIVAKNTDSSLIYFSALVRLEDLSHIEPFLNPLDRGHLYIYLLRKPVEWHRDDYPDPIIADNGLMIFTEDVNETFFTLVEAPKQDDQREKFKIQALPPEASRAFFTLFYFDRAKD